MSIGGAGEGFQRLLLRILVRVHEAFPVGDRDPPAASRGQRAGW